MSTGPEVLLESMQPEALVANIYKHIPASIEGTERNRLIQQLSVHRNREVFQHLIQCAALWDDAYRPFLPNNLDSGFLVSKDLTTEGTTYDLALVGNATLQ